MRRFHKALTLALLAAPLACTDFLSGGELDTDPARPTTATNSQIFVGTQSALWSVLMSDPARIAALWTQQLTGTNIQTQAIYNYDVTEQTTNGFHQAIYITGGLVDVRKLQARALEMRDSLMLGIAQVEEALLVGTAADLFGDITYSEALQFDRQNPRLDPQLEVYDALQALLDRAIVALRSTAATNQGPGDADLSYGGDATQWTRLAYTLKARLYLHTAEVRPAAYAQALAAARQGITEAADDYVARFSGALNEQNFWYQFDVVQRAGYLAPDPQFVELLRTRSDPRLGRYFNANQTGFHADLVQPDRTQALVTAVETLLIWAEAAQRGGDDAEARTQLNRARALSGLGAAAGTLAGRALLNEILLEKYIALFQSIEVLNDYKRTCTPNLAPAVAGSKIPARLLYDDEERVTNINIKNPTEQPTRNANDPANALSDGTGAACLGQ
jgi:hypothetical protein